MTYHYAECGLDYVYLENGYVSHDTPYGKGVSIERAEELHAAIGSLIAGHPAPLRGVELRFLRVEMELTQRGLAGILGATEQTLRLWEKHRNKAIPGPADRLLRALYLEFVNGKSSVRRMVDRLAELDHGPRPVARMRETKDGWRPEDGASSAAD
jgi:DNA-binding transcriptional regulator YiaG